MTHPVALLPPRLTPVPCAGAWSGAWPRQPTRLPPRLADCPAGTPPHETALSLARYLAGTVVLSAFVVAPLVVLAMVLVGLWWSDDISVVSAVIHQMTAPASNPYASPGYLYPSYGLVLIWLLSSICAAGGQLISNPWTPPLPDTSHGVNEDVRDSVRVVYHDHGAADGEWPGARVPCALSGRHPFDDVAFPGTGVLMPAPATSDATTTNLADGMAAQWAAYQALNGKMSLTTWLIRVDAKRSFPAMITSHTAESVHLMILQTLVPFVMTTREFDARKGGAFLLDPSLRHTAPETYSKHSGWLRAAFMSLNLSVGIAAD